MRPAKGRHGDVRGGSDPASSWASSPTEILAVSNIELNLSMLAVTHGLFAFRWSFREGATGVLAYKTHVIFPA